MKQHVHVKVLIMHGCLLTPDPLIPRYSLCFVSTELSLCREYFYQTLHWIQLLGKIKYN